MADDKATNSHDEARRLAEQGLDKAADGDLTAGKKLAEQARKLDPSAAEEVMQEAEKDSEAAAKYQPKG